MSTKTAVSEQPKPEGPNGLDTLWAPQFGDLCDACGVASAFVRAQTSKGDLLFCAHHYTEHEVSLAAAGIVVDDARHLIAA